MSYWNSIASDADAKYDDVVNLEAKDIEPTVTWGINPGQAVGITERLPKPDEYSDPVGATKAYEHMGWQPGAPILGTPINVAFIGSCTNGLHEIFREAGFEWREAGCSMCLAMNPDKLHGKEVSASSSNRNFIGRQGSPQGRTLLMSPAMVAAAALNGKVVDVRDYQ